MVSALRGAYGARPRLCSRSAAPAQASPHARGGAGLVHSKPPSLVPPDEERWKAYLTDDEPPEAAFFCPERAEREFGELNDKT
jgi:hypothetical protein